MQTWRVIAGRPRVAAVAGHADLLVTGDQDLLVLANRAPLLIVSPRDAWEHVHGQY